MDVTLLTPIVIGTVGILGIAGAGLGAYVGLQRSLIRIETKMDLHLKNGHGHRHD